jgi:hypothetical protein
VFTDKDTQCIDNDDLPTDKLTFDASFAVTTNRNSAYCQLMINSASTFHQIKVGGWDLLQNFNVWLEKSPGPITKTDVVPMGFWLHIHPGFAITSFGQNIRVPDEISRWSAFDRQSGTTDRRPTNSKRNRQQ